MKSKKLPGIVMLAIFSFITALIWGASDLIRTLSKKPEAEVPTEVLEPISPILDQEALEKIESAVFFDESQIPNLVLPSPSPLESVIPTPTPSASSAPSASASASPSNQASPSALPSP